MGDFPNESQDRENHQNANSNVQFGGVVGFLFPISFRIAIVTVSTIYIYPLELWGPC